MLEISTGAGIKNPKCESAEVKSLFSFLKSVPRSNEGWWSNHLWKSNHRKTENWLYSTALVLDIDHHGTAADPKKRHTEPAKNRRDALEVAGLPVTWHHTPRGARAVVELQEPCSDQKKFLAATKAFGRYIQEFVAEAGVAARRDKKGKPIDGYAVDVATYDAARLYYTPNAIVEGRQRSARIFKGRVQSISIEELAGLEDEDDNASVSDERVADEEIADVLCKMPCEGEKDGSMELVRVARKAIGLGVSSSEEFCVVASKWNRERSRPWTDDELTKRYDDVKAKWEENGMAQVVAANYSRAALHKILETDHLYKNRLKWDVIEQTVLFEGKIANDNKITDIEVDICTRYAYKDVPKRHLIDSLYTIASKQEVNRITDYLSGLEWDGKKRLADLIVATRIIEKHHEAAMAYYPRFLRSAVVRAVDPGCKVDTMLVLHGPTGYLKSTFFRALAGKENFRDTQIDLSSKDAYQQNARAWIYEWSELESITQRADVARVKNFLSSAVDNYRGPYERIATDHPRRGVPVGTSNSPDLLMDPDSNRRFWILSVGGKIDIGWVEKNRDQLWAETVHQLLQAQDSEFKDVPWWLTEEEEFSRAKINRDFEPDRITDILGKIVHKLGDKKCISSHELYTKLGMDPVHTSQPTRSLIASHMIRLGWRRANVRVEGVMARVYKRIVTK